MLHAHRTFAAELTSPARARRFVRRALVNELPTDRVETAVLLVSELAANAVLHARTEFELRLSVTARTLRVALSDGSSRPPLPVVVDGNATSGRGLRMLDLLASRWGTDHTATGKSVWFELELVDGKVIDLAEARAAFARAAARPSTRRRVRS